MNVNKSSWSCITTENTERLPQIHIPRPEDERENLDDIMSLYRATPTFKTQHKIETVTSYPFEENVEEYMNLHRNNIVLRQNNEKRHKSR